MPSGELVGTTLKLTTGREVMDGHSHFPTQSTHRKEIPGVGRPFITTAMPLDPAFGFAMVVFFFEDWIPHEYYSYAENLRGVLMS